MGVHALGGGDTCTLHVGDRETEHRQSNLRTKDTLGMGLLSFLWRLSLSRRFAVFYHPQNVKLAR